MREKRDKTSMNFFALQFWKSETPSPPTFGNYQCSSHFPSAYKAYLSLSDPLLRFCGVQGLQKEF